jgi:hypothetical protein
LLDRVVDGLQSNVSLRVRMRVIRAVSRRDDARICGAGAYVDPNPVFTVQACTFRKFSVGYDPDADDNQITIKRVAVRARYPANDVLSAETRDFRVAANVDPRRGMLPSIEIGCLVAYDATHHTFCRFEDRDLDSKLDCHGCDLESDVPASYNHEPRALVQLPCNCVDVHDRANVMDARQRGSGNGNPAHATSSREQQAVITEIAAVRQTNAAQPDVEFLGPSA